MMPAAHVSASPTSSSACEQAARRLLSEAQHLESLEQFSAAESVLQAAVACSPCPETMLAHAEFLVRRERLEDARAAYRLVWNHAALCGDSKLLSVVLHNLASVERQLGDWSAARSHQFRALAAGYEADDSSSEETAAELTGRGLDAMAEGDYALAENLLLRSLAIERSLGARDGEAADCGNLGVLAGLRGDLAVGIRFLARAYTIHRELNDEHGSGSDLLNLAEIFINSGRLSLAEKCLRRAIGNFRRVGAAKSLANAESRLTEVTQVIGVLNRDPLLN